MTKQHKLNNYKLIIDAGYAKLCTMEQLKQIDQKINTHIRDRLSDQEPFKFSLEKEVSTYCY